MHDIKWIRENPDAFDRGLARRGLEPQAERLISIDERRRAIIRVNEAASARRKVVPKELAKAKSENDVAEVQKLMNEAAEIRETIAQTDKEQREAEKELRDALAEIPNLPLDEVPDGKDEKDNVQYHHFGAKRAYAFGPKQHFDLGEALGQMDFETAAKLSGARFVVLKKGLARLERALGQFFLDVHTTEHGYTEVAPPLLVLQDTMFGTAQLPKFAEDQFQTTLIRDRAASADTKQKIETNLVLPNFEQWSKNFDPTSLTWTQDFKTFTISTVLLGAKDIARWVVDDPNMNERRWLIPTAEVPLTNLVRDSIADEAELPLRYTACTPCFRQEAGAAGKDTRGMIRQHQFTKVELVSITTPEQSRDEHERMLSCAEEVLKRLDLHYRVVTLCTGDMGFASQKTYDIEVWLPGQNAYREISSCSNCGDFQARRMKARYRPGPVSGGGALYGAMQFNQAMYNEAPTRLPPRHVHTLNGSGVAVGRALIAVMETYQQEDGSIAVPDALAPYMGGLKKIEK